MQHLHILSGTITTLAAPGAVSLPGAKVGDVVFGVGDFTRPEPSFLSFSDGNSSNFESTISVADEIQQITVDDEAFEVPVLLLRPVS